MTHDAFGRLRLGDFIGSADLVPLRDWEYLDRIWTGEACGFTEWLRLESDPDVTRSVALDCQALPDTASRNMLAALGLPLRPGMDRTEVIAALSEPTGTEQFVPDRLTLLFSVGAYQVSCTVHDEHGLTYLTVHPTPLPE